MGKHFRLKEFAWPVFFGLAITGIALGLMGLGEKFGELKCRAELVKEVKRG